MTFLEYNDQLGQKMIDLATIIGELGNRKICKGIELYINTNKSNTSSDIYKIPQNNETRR